MSPFFIVKLDTKILPAILTFEGGVYMYETFEYEWLSSLLTWAATKKCPSQMSPFFVVKLDIKILPAILVFKGGVVTDRIVGFESFGQRDDFPTSVLEDRLWVFGILGKAAKGPDDEDEEEYVAPSKIRQGGAIKTASDEDSDFDDV
jgi:hypothetical protein